MKRVLIESQYLPSLEFFCAISSADELQIEMCEHFVKQSFRNHALIKTTNGVVKLTVPLSEKRNRTIIKDIKMEGSSNWRNNQWRTIESAYRKSPFYEHYADALHQIIFNKCTRLVELNMELLTLCLHWLRWEKKISVTEIYQVVPDECSDLRNAIVSKKSYTERNYYKPVPYTQVFGNVFVENLSLIDLIFCKGPDSGSILRTSCLNL